MSAIKFNATLNSFFDRESVMAPAKRAEKKFLGRVGAYVRTVAMNSIKTRPLGEISMPGDPPFNHAGSLGRRSSGKGRGYKDFIFFSYDEASHSVYIGPVLLNGQSGPNVCRTLEYGGDELIWVTHLGKRVQVMAHFEPRPHMRPALRTVIESQKFRDFLKDCVVNEAGTSARLA